MSVYLFNVEAKQEIITVKDDKKVNDRFDDWLRSEVEGGFLLYEVIRNKKDKDEN